MKSINRTSTSTAVLTAFSIILVQIVRADSTPIDISGLVNSDLTTYSGGGNYPQHGGVLTVNGVAFNLATIGQGADTAVIQSSPNDGVAQTYSIPIGLFGVTSAYTLINSAFGDCNQNIGELDFIGSSTTVQYLLTEGTNVRDHFDGSFCNMVTNIAGTAYFGGGMDRLDMQSVDLTALGSQTLQRIDFKSYGDGWGGAPFLAALTLDAPADPPGDPVPEPRLFPLALIGLLVVVKAVSRFL